MALLNSYACWFSGSRRPFPASNTAWTMGPSPSCWWATWAVLMETSCLRNTPWSPLLLSSRPCWESELMDWITGVLLFSSFISFKNHPHWSSAPLQECHLPEGLCRSGGGGSLCWPRRRIRHPAGEPPLPCRWGGKGQGRRRKQGESPSSLSVEIEDTVTVLFNALVQHVFGLAVYIGSKDTSF